MEIDEYITTPQAVDDVQTMSLAKYMLTSDIPVQQRRDFAHLFLLFDKDYALANLKRIDMPYFNLTYELVCELMECDLLDYAREVMVQAIQDLKLSRSVDALQLKLGVTGVQRRESVQKIEGEMRKKGLSSKIAGVFKKNEQEQDEWSEY